MKHAQAFISACAEGWQSVLAAERNPDAHVAGTLTTRVVPGTPMRTESRWEGALAGDARFTLISLEETDTPGAKVSRYHGDLVLSTPRGDLIGQDHGLWNLEDGSYVDVYHVTSGTGAYAGATAVFYLWGKLDPVSGEGPSQYRGLVTTR
jgi:hypothetical protein